MARSVEALKDYEIRDTVDLAALGPEELEPMVEAGREIIEISMQQMENFAGNLLELATESGQTVIVLSRAAFAALTADQRNSLACFGQVLPVAIETIEKAGGGSVRCMLAEVFLPRSPVSAAIGVK